MLLNELAERIRSQRRKRGLKQIDIAHALQVSPQAVSKWEQGENAPDIAILGALAQLLGVSTDYLLGLHAENQDVFEATVFASSVQGAFRKSLAMSARDFAAWANGFFFQLTEAVLRHDGVPLKYMGDGFLCFFSGSRHAERAVEATRRARTVVSEALKIGLSSGEIYLGSMGHPDYARPDIMGEAVNLAFLTMEWAEASTKSGVAATRSVADQIPPAALVGRAHQVTFKGVANAVKVYEIK
jgi:class 3 adenylate cyclase